MVDGTRRWWGGPLDTERLARTEVSRVRDAAAELAAARGLDIRIDTSEALTAASFAAHEHLRMDGRALQAWGEFSGFVAARDGWVRVHGNYPHHAAIIREVLGVDDRAGLEREVGRREAAEVETRISAAGGIAVAVRTEDEWHGHPHHRATADDPWSSVVERRDRPELSSLREPITAPAGAVAARPATLPLRGVRVLDLTRVIAGPTCTQLLACLGADVLRIDPPHRPEILAQHLSTGMGKRSALLDLRRDADRLRALAAEADVILDGYRPGALVAHGLGTEDLGRTAPQAVLVSLSAWGEHGPWGGRPGFDSIVQATTGIAVRCGTGGEPGALPVQALDHASGHRMAGHILDVLLRGRAATIRVNLLGAARTLLAEPSPEARTAPAALGRETLEVLEVPRVTVLSADGPLETVPPPLQIEGRTLEAPVGGYGSATVDWAWWRR
ncbi:acyl-CoA transferase [Brachybacterium sp. P6-10-X1]|uniref:CoA transferase n=1 Tax=Brachybacterium sp. P6-10-X1 TaxID=1903186 RepID=UPI0009717441|nr:CoA transferase [Brachybacterium sp. P6-10-X1]APX32681.1 acyl-CoA transferase [Brachybacterium sp. P6-10-X1]